MSFLIALKSVDGYCDMLMRCNVVQCRTIRHRSAPSIASHIVALYGVEFHSVASY
jgi:hypothetical protein